MATNNNVLSNFLVIHLVQFQKVFYQAFFYIFIYIDLIQINLCTFQPPILS